MIVPRSLERATAAVLAPALLLVVIALGCLSVDVAVAHAARRDLYRTLSAAADDAAAMLDERMLQRDGTVALDRAAAERVARAHLGVLRESLRGEAGSADAPRRVIRSEVAVGDHDVTVSATIEVDRVFLSAIPGLGDSFEVQVTTVGRAVP